MIMIMKPDDPPDEAGFLVYTNDKGEKSCEKVRPFYRV